MKKLILLGSLFLTFLSLNAQNVVQIGDSYSLLDTHLQILEDSTKTWTIAQVSSPAFAEKFEKTPFHTINFGLSTSGYWGRITLSAKKSQTYWLEFANPNIRNASVFYFDSLQNQFVEIKKERQRPPEEKVLRLPTAVFPIPLATSPKVFYFRVSNVFPFTFPVVLWQAEKFTGVQSNLNLFTGLFWGVIIVMLLYNFLMYLMVRDNIFLIYTFLMLFEGLNHLTISGYADMYFLNGLEEKLSNIINLIVFPLAGLAKVIFVAYFMQVRKYNSLFFKLLLVIALFKFLLIYFAVSTLISYFIIFFFISNVITHVCYLVLGITFLRYTPSNALFFTIASGIHLLGIVMYILQGMNFGQLDYISYTYSSLISGGVAYGLEIIFVSLALSNRVNLMKAELTQKEYEKKLIAQEEALKLKYEKDRISKDLHDNIGSQLTLLAKNLENLKQEPENEKIKSLNEMTQNIIQDLRSMIWVINKEEVSIRDLEDRITTLLWKTLGQMEAIFYEVKTDFQKELNLTASQALNLYRITQEALQNAIKYSQAQNIEIQISTDANGQIFLQIKDDGVGFDFAKNQSKKGQYGLQNMQSRAEELGAVLKIETAKGRGTAINISL